MTILAVNTRLARWLRRDFDDAQQSAGAALWEPPDVLTWAGWLTQLWDEVVYTGGDGRVLLSGMQERVLWENVIRESDAGEDLLNVNGAASAAAAAWQFLHDWRLPRHRAAFEGVPDTEAFFQWMSAFQEKLFWGGFITSAELPGALPPVLTRGALDFIAGFDELTPVQKVFLGACAEYPVAPLKVRDRCRMGCADELATAAHWVRERLSRNPSARLGVVLVDLVGRRAPVGRVFEEVLGTRDAFHISAPTALSEVPLVRAALLALKGDECALARSPFFQHTAEAGSRFDLARRRGKGDRKLVPVACNGGPRKPSAWSAEFWQGTLQTGWPGLRTLTSEEYQGVESWKELLADFSRFDLVVDSMEPGSALELLERMAQEKGFGAEEQDEPVQVMGVLEAAGARFDALWIGGLHDAAWPPVAAENPFIPPAMQRSVADRYSFALQTTKRLLSAAPEVVCSWPLLGGEENLRASPFITGLEERSFSVPVGSTPAAVWEETADNIAPPLEGTLQRGGMSVIADQSLCPFRAFARHRLGARALETREEGLSLQERGIVMHDALRMLWSELRTQSTLLEMDSLELARLIAKCAHAALDRNLAHRGERMRALEATRISGLLKEWMWIEKARPSFETSDMESKRTLTVGGLQVEVRMDRVDRYRDGTLALVDYKTGKLDTPRQWETARPESPQLPLYSTAMDERVSSVMFARLAAGDLKLVGISDCGESVKQREMASQIGEWREVVNSLGAAFVAGDATVEPLRKACERCDLQGLCRISASAAEADE